MVKEMGHNINMEIYSEGGRLIEMAENRVQWQALILVTWNVRLCCQRVKLCCIEYVYFSYNI